MAIAGSAAGHEEEIGGKRRRLLLRNGEIERFEAQHAPLGIFDLWDQLVGARGRPQARHVRDLVALGLVGAGLRDSEADAVLASLGPDHNLTLLAIAQRLMVQTFFPDAAKTSTGKKKAAGSQKVTSATARDAATTMPETSSPTSAG